MLSVPISRGRVHLGSRVEATSAVVVPTALRLFPVIVVPLVRGSLVVVGLTEIAVLSLLMIVVVGATITLTLATLLIVAVALVSSVAVATVTPVAVAVIVVALATTGLIITFPLHLK